MTIRGGKVDWALWKPLGPETEPEITPDVLIYHTMVGYLQGTYDMFKSGGFDGTESTWGLGGPWDKGNLDGVLWQFQFTNREADAQFAGNAYANSCECSDGGSPNNQFSTKMLNSLIQLTVDWCHYTGAPALLVPSSGPVGKGLGWHELRADWNENHHVCPGPVREGQLRTLVIPKARALLTGAPVPPAPRPIPKPAHHDAIIAVDGILGVATISGMQHVLKEHKYYNDRVDGIMGPNTRVGLQRYLRSLKLYKGGIDGIVGPQTVQALQHHVGSKADGIWGHDTTKHIQSALNNGRF